MVKVKSNIYYFNPTAELAVINGLYDYNPSLTLSRFEEEMAAIMLHFASETDLVVVKRLPDPGFLNAIKTIKPCLSSFITLPDLLAQEKRYDRLIPWGWSPSVYSTFRKILNQFTVDLSAVDPLCEQTRLSGLYSRLKALNVVQLLVISLNKLEQKQLLATNLQAEICRSIQEVSGFVDKTGSTVLKAPVSSSGRGLQMLRKKRLNHSNVAWVKSVLEKQGFIMAEPLHNKIADVSFHYRKLKDQNPEFLGTIFFETNTNGQFKGCYINAHPDKSINDFIDISKQSGVIDHLADAIDSEYKNYEGFLGVDAMVVNETGAFKLHPCVEINPRFTMGLLTLELRKSLEKTNAWWQMHYEPKGQLQRHLTSNCVPLTPIEPGTQFGAILHFSE